MEQITCYVILRMGAMGSLDNRQKWRKEETPISVDERREKIL